MKFKEDIILIAGPTASGKTGLAIKIAKANDCVIVNTDSMQVYRDLRAITARPSPGEEAEVPHYLFGHVDAATAYSVAQWLEDVRPLLETFVARRKKLIFVGGTGLYFNALTEGLSPMPDIDRDIRKKWRLASETPSEDLYKILTKLDALAGAQLRPSDRQRIIRALEVFESTGRSIVNWQSEKGAPILPNDIDVKKLLLMPERSLLHERINRRFDVMVEEGALVEVENLLARDLDSSLPAMKAIGVPHLACYLRNEVTLEEAVEKAKAATRQYAKRQSTWFRNSFGDDWQTVV